MTTNHPDLEKRIRHRNRISRQTAKKPISLADHKDNKPPLAEFDQSLWRRIFGELSFLRAYELICRIGRMKSRQPKTAKDPPAPRAGKLPPKLRRKRFNINRHHMIPHCKGGRRVPQNLLAIRIPRHEALHQMFGVMNWKTIGQTVLTWHCQQTRRKAA